MTAIQAGMTGYSGSRCELLILAILNAHQGTAEDTLCNRFSEAGSKQVHVQWNIFAVAYGLCLCSAEAWQSSFQHVDFVSEAIAQRVAFEA